MVVGELNGVTQKAVGQGAYGVSGTRHCNANVSTLKSGRIVDAITRHAHTKA